MRFVAQPIAAASALVFAIAGVACSLAFDDGGYSDRGDGGASAASSSGGSGSPGSASGSSGSSGSGSGSGASSGGASSTSSGAIPPGGRLLTFEDGAVVHAATGADKTTGNPLIVAGASALAGTYSLGVNANSSFATVSFMPRADVFVSFLVRMNRATNAQIIRVVLDQPGSELQVRLGEGAATAWSIDSGSQASLGSAPLAVGEVRRLGIHYHAGTTSGEAELYAGGPSGPMSRAGGTSSSAYRATVSAVDIGATTATAFDGSFDGVRIATDGFGL